MQEQKVLIIGIGTGRCGSASLAGILNMQMGAQITHESKPRPPWNADHAMLSFKLETILNREGKWVGDIGMYYLPYVREIIAMHPSVRVIYLERDEDQVVRSFLVKTEKRNHWMYHDGLEYRIDDVWDPLFPKFKAENKEEALKAYVSSYRQAARAVIAEYPERVFFLKTEELTDPKRITELLRFIGVPEAQMVIEQVHKNQTKSKLRRKVEGIYRAVYRELKDQ